MPKAIAFPRLTPRLVILLALWGLFLLWTGLETISYSLTLLTGTVDRFAPAGPAIYFALNFWGFAAGLLFGLVIVNPFAWLNGKRLVFGCMAFGIMLGRLTGGSIGGLLLYTPIARPVIFVGTPIVLMLGGMGVIFVVAIVLGLLFTVLVGVPVVLFNQIFEFERALNVYRYQARGLAGYIIRAVYWLRNESLPAPPPDDSKGARFATRAEVQKLHRPVPESMAFGHWGNPLFLKTDKHVLIMASTRSGKGVTLIIPHLLRYQGSAFVLDPKGENARATGRQRAELNARVHYLDPFGISGKPQSRFNPLTRFTPENMEAESKALAAAMFVSTSSQGRQNDHWMASGQQLLASIILFVYVSRDIAPEAKDLPQVRRLLLGNLKPTLELMMELDDHDGLLRDLATSFLETPKEEFGSIVSTAQRQTEILDNPYMIACLSAKGESPQVDFKDWHHSTMTVYLCLSAPKFPIFNRWLRMVLTSALDEMTETLAPPKLPVCFMLDELATLGHLATVENAVGLAAGYGIQLVTIFQDVAQMKDLYRGRWASFVGNSGVRALFNLDDYDTAEYWSKFIGGRLVETRGRQEDLYGYSKGENVGETMRPLLASDKIMMDFASGYMLVLAQGAHPVVTKRVAYWNDASLNGLWDDPRLTGASGSPPAAPPAGPTPNHPPPKPNGAAPHPKPDRVPSNGIKPEPAAQPDIKAPGATNAAANDVQTRKPQPSENPQAATPPQNPPTSSPEAAITAQFFSGPIVRRNPDGTFSAVTEPGSQAPTQNPPKPSSEQQRNRKPT